MKAVLFDLDGTLLENSFHDLINEYFQRLAVTFTPWIEPQRFLDHLMASTEVMIANLDPGKTNLEVFADDFFARTELAPELMDVFDRFYAEEFPKLRGLAKPHPLARSVVEQAFSQGLRVVIATNPIFPAQAIEERLRWADVGDLPFALVTTGENMHFCKPHTEYYQEISSILGIAPEQCLMVGDDPQMDGPAAAIGMDTFLLIHGRGLKELGEKLG